MTDAARRQQEVLSRQVAALREQLSGLQALLDDAKVREAASQVQLQSLGNELNAALARVAAEERRRAELEEEKRKLLEAENLALERYRSEFFGQLRDLLGTQEGVRIVGDRFVFSSEVLFAPGEAQLSPEGQGEIAQIAGILRNIADDIPPEIDWVLQIDGHTDNVPIIQGAQFADNWELSQARALSVVRYMVNFLGIPPDRLSANGFGQYQPVNTADTPEARAQNRRIELKFTEK
jgi:chemotaxis protein MotB